MEFNKKLVCINTELSDWIGRIATHRGFLMEKGRVYYFKSRTMVDDVVGMFPDKNGCLGFFPHGTLEDYFQPLEDWLVANREKQLDSLNLDL